MKVITAKVFLWNQLNLQADVVQLKLFTKEFVACFELGAVIKRAFKVSRDSIFTIWETPYMQVVNTLHTIDSLKLLSDCWQTCFHWGAFHKHPNAVHKSDARGIEHNYRKYVGTDRVHIPGAWDEVNDQSCYQYADWVDNVTEDVKIGCLHV